ncbi:hypothetical protein EYF80_001124 [Liparis tanakae]|uniref:Uncharacterized protein n=1 Tax=Liparis tanakae TaxID=230148 RepID=A0A4Z2JHP6_9TELE|nr:hypothetical protein EYF80_001124 [Liparis tanakae]
MRSLTVHPSLQGTTTPVCPNVTVTFIVELSLPNPRPHLLGEAQPQLITLGYARSSDLRHNYGFDEGLDQQMELWTDNTSASPLWFPKVSYEIPSLDLGTSAQRRLVEEPSTLWIEADKRRRRRRRRRKRGREEKEAKNEEQVMALIISWGEMD